MVGKNPGFVCLNGTTSAGKVTVFAVKLAKSNAIQTKEEFDSDPSYRAAVVKYSRTLSFTSDGSRRNSVYTGIKNAIKIIPALCLADRMNHYITCPQDFNAVVREEIAKKYPQGLKADEISSMDFTLYNAIKFVYRKQFLKRDNFVFRLKYLVDEEYRERHRAKNRSANLTSEQVERAREISRAWHLSRRLKLATEAAQACTKLPTGPGILKSPPDGWMEQHKCAGDYVDYCMNNRIMPPSKWHAMPLAYHAMYRAEGDPIGTLYPGKELPDGILELIVNTRTDAEWSTWLWANLFPLKCFQFVENHKGGIISKRQEFCMLAMHPTNPQYHLFRQDYFIDHNGNPHIPFHRETYLKSASKCTFDAIFRYTPRDDGGWDATKVHDPKNLYPDDGVELTNEDIV